MFLGQCSGKTQWEDVGVNTMDNKYTCTRRQQTDFNRETPPVQMSKSGRFGDSLLCIATAHRIALREILPSPNGCAEQPSSISLTCFDLAACEIVHKRPRRRPRSSNPAKGLPLGKVYPRHSISISISRRPRRRANSRPTPVSRSRTPHRTAPPCPRRTPGWPASPSTRRSPLSSRRARTRPPSWSVSRRRRSAP